ncbi:beta-propeller fold lactonase family protein [Nibribacter ruber]|uniref:Beta-propeller fold lactonase family protein n=1 Tax=Nibribacter ruber TaxID=2698458 RepID=A0A6P1NZT5_9BACT|nr:lactonase family protein [Nibribacter ruber]QHL87498.1 beta-propeller fold lactonase family protein [Nibribacter ruber]
MLVYVGTYAKQDSAGIFGYRLNEETGTLTKAFDVKAGPNPSYLALDVDRKHLYAVNEISEFEGQKTGAVSAFAIDQTTGNLTFLNRQTSLGSAPCYVSLDQKNQLALVANYAGGTVTPLKLNADGSLTKPMSSQVHQGAGPKPQQKSAHAHCILPDPFQKYILAVDLGIDQVMTYKANAASGELEKVGIGFEAKKGAGPRHLTFHPNKHFAYLVNELDGTLTVLDYQPEAGTFTHVETLSTLPAEYQKESFGADVHVSKDGRFVYASNRGHNSIAVFQINQTSGRLTLVQHMSTHGDWPRNFTLTPSGRMLLVANQRSQNITTYHVDPQTGKLTYTGNSINLSSPVYLQVVPLFTGSEQK